MGAVVPETIEIGNLVLKLSAGDLPGFAFVVNLEGMVVGALNDDHWYKLANPVPLTHIYRLRTLRPPHSGEGKVTVFPTAVSRDTTVLDIAKQLGDDHVVKALTDQEAKEPKE